MTDFVQQSDPFTASAGGSLEGLKFPEIGHSETGVVVAVDERDDTGIDGEAKTWPDGRPKRVWIFTLQQADGVERALWVRGNLVKAIREAVAEAGVATVIGATLSVQHHALGDKKPGLNPAKLFRAKLEPPAPPTVAAKPW